MPKWIPGAQWGVGIECTPDHRRGFFQPHGPESTRQPILEAGLLDSNYPARSISSAASSSNDSKPVSSAIARAGRSLK